MVYQIKKFLSNKLSILNEDIHIQKSGKGFYYLKMTEIRNQENRKTLQITQELDLYTLHVA